MIIILNAFVFKFFLGPSSFAMIYLRIKQPLYSLLLLLCVAYALDVSDVPSDSPQRLGLGRHQDLGLNQNAPKFMESGQTWSHHEFSGDAVNSGGINEPIQQRTSKNKDTGLADAEGAQNQPSELSDLFAGRRGSATVESSSAVSLITTEKAFLAKEESKNPIASDLTSASTESRPRSTSFNLNTSSSKPLIVPSEGGLTQDLSPVMSVKSGTLKTDSISSNVPDNLERKESETMSNTAGTFLHQGDTPVVKKQLKPQDSHISARKGANLSDKPEPTSSSINDTSAQFTFSSSESPFIKEVRTQKIAPRKGAEPPKIFPRKGVEEKIDNHNSSDPFYSEANNDNGPTSTESNSTPLLNDLVPKPTTAYASDIADNVKNVTMNKANPFQNKLGVDLSLKASTPSLGSTSSVAMTNMSTLEPPTLKQDTTSDIKVKNSSIYSNVIAPLTEVKNDTEDKSGIIASYPPLKKRLKPLKTTDTNMLTNSPPPEHTSSGHDYVVPIVVTILTIPMLVVLVLFLYKKGAEFWERRHYRRMDFLIDGMYND